MFDKLEEVERRYLEVEAKLSDPALGSKPNEFRRLSQEHSSLKEVVEEYRHFKKLKEDIKGNKELLEDGDSEMEALARTELEELEPEFESTKRNLQILLLPKDPNDDKNVVLELRGGAGGDEAALFAGDLFRAYCRFAERQGWKVDLMSANELGIGGYKEVVAMISGDRVFSRLKHEAGVHRVQRVPQTESQGRIHTSTITVAVLPEAEEVDVTINPADLKIDVFRAGGAGGQHVNTTDSAVRMTHIPTGVIVNCQDERSQIKNREKALKVLRARIYEIEREKAAREYADDRKSMVGTGDRSERIRTYNYPQGRVTDHRIGLTLHQLPEIMEGKLDELLDRVQAFYQMEQLKSQGLEKTASL